ncbi:hypothetical protein GCM10010270_86870 [Streptomyces violaceus]|nr:hypothetical protein GCM10010270_86870 [Streptomyces janthinus]
MAALKSIRAARPDGAPIYVILGNLSAHKGADIRRWAKKNKVNLCFTPTYASWANPIEAHFGPLRQFHHRQFQPPQPHRPDSGPPRLPALAQRQRPPPSVLAAQCRERARICSEKGIRWGGRPLRVVA